MNRRKFIQNTGNATLVASMFPTEILGGGENSWDNELIERFTGQNDELIDSILNQQQDDESKPFYGGFPNDQLIFHVGTAAGYVSRMMCGLVWRGSKYFRSKKVATAATRAMDFVKRQQHDDGTIDLITTNFHSPPDTGFVVEPISLALSLSRQHAPEQHLEFQKTAESFLESAGEALAVGGIHTPNHRWVVCMALAWINYLIPDKKLVARIDQWLGEGIDVDSEGHFNERSTSVYSPLTDRCLITVARLLGRAELLDPVRKNLELTPFLVHPNGEIVTEVSRRQDQFRVAKMGNYYYPYRYMAITDSNERFAAMGRMIEKTVGIENLSGNLPYLLDDSNLTKQMPKEGGLVTNYEKQFQQSKIVRIRREQIDATILAENETFMSIHKRDAALRAIRFATAFFGKGQFSSPTLEKANGKYILKQSLTGPYLQPLSNEFLPPDADWSKMPKHRRRQSEVQTLESSVSIEESAGVFKLTFSIKGTDGVPLAIELAFSPGGEFGGVVPVPGIAGAYLIEQDSFTYSNGGDTIKVAGARNKHAWTQLRGASPKLDAECVYITDYTPFQFEMTIS